MEAAGDSVLPRVLFVIGLLAILLLPGVLLFSGRRRALPRRKDTEGDAPELRVAYGLAWISYGCALAELLLALLPSGGSRHLGPELYALFPLVSFLTGSIGLVLFVIFGRGAERWTGPVSAMLAIVLAVLLTFAGMVAA